jgi:hypothetical protein
MNCERFERLLDANGPGDLPADVLAHANACARCARALAAARSIDMLLVTSSAVKAPSGFTDRVLARIRLSPAAAPARALPQLAAPFDPLPAWIRIASEPATAGALVVAALVMWQAPRLLQIGRMIAATIAARATGGGALIDPTLWPSALRAATGNDAVQLALVVTGCSLAPLVAFSLYRLSERMVAGGRRPR